MNLFLLNDVEEKFLVYSRMEKSVSTLISPCRDAACRVSMGDNAPMYTVALAAPFSSTANP